MKAPETIYLATTDEVQNLDNSFIGIAHNNPNDIIEPIEYIRKDAIIEKACEWIKEKWDNNYTMPIIIDSVIEDFKKYIEDI